MFFSICLAKKNAEVIKFLGILKKYVSENKIYFCSRKKSNVSLNKKVIFVFHTIFKLGFITQIIYCIIHRCLHSHFILFCSLVSVSKKWNIETMLTFPHSYNWQKFNTHKMNGKRSQQYQSMGSEYVTGQSNSCIVELLMRRLCCLIFALQFDKAFSQRLQKIFQPFTSVDTASSGAYKSFPTIDKRFWLTSIEGLT